MIPVPSHHLPQLQQLNINMIFSLSLKHSRMVGKTRERLQRSAHTCGMRNRKGGIESKEKYWNEKNDLSAGLERLRHTPQLVRQREDRHSRQHQR